MQNRPLEPLEARRLLTLAIDYPMEEGSGRTVADVAPLYGAQTASLLGGAQWTPTDGRVLSSSHAISLNGTDASLLTEDFNWMIAENATVSAWIKTTDVGGTDPASSPGLLGTYGGGRGIAWGWIDNCGRINFTVPGPTPLNGRDTVTSDFPINDGTWYHVLMTRDVTAGEIKLYVNGLLQDHALADPTLRSAIDMSEIGVLRDVRGDSPPRYLNASIDKFHVYNEALTDSQAALDFDPQGREPAAPTNLRVISVGGRAITLAWDHVLGASGYEVWRSFTGAGSFEKVAFAPPTGRFTDTGLDGETSYEYRIRAVNPFATSAFSTAAIGRTVVPQWDAPIGIRGSAGDDEIRVEVRGEDVYVWNSASCCNEPYHVSSLRDHDGILIESGGGSDRIHVEVAPGSALSEHVTLNGGAGDDDIRLSGIGMFQLHAADAGFDDLTLSSGAVAHVFPNQQLDSLVFDGPATVAFSDGTVGLRSITSHTSARIEIGSGTLQLLDSPHRDVMLRRLEALAAIARAATPPWSGNAGLTSSSVNSPLKGIAVGHETRVTFNGDANLDGRINADDYFAIDQGFLAQPQDPLYSQGDFNYDGRVNADDYFLIDQAFLGQPAVAAQDAPRAASQRSTSSFATEPVRTKKRVRAVRNTVF